MQHSYNAKFYTIGETIIKGRGYWRSNLQTVLPLKTFACRQENIFSRPAVVIIHIIYFITNLILIACGEAKGILPIKTLPLYSANGLKVVNTYYLLLSHLQGTREEFL